MSRAIGSSGLRPPVPEARKAANAASRSAGQAARHQRLRDATLVQLLELEEQGFKAVTEGGPLPRGLFLMLASRELVEPVWRLTPAGRRRAAALRREWNA